MFQDLIIQGVLVIVGMWVMAKFIFPLISHYLMEIINGDSRKKMMSI